MIAAAAMLLAQRPWVRVDTFRRIFGER